MTIEPKVTELEDRIRDAICKPMPAAVEQRLRLKIDRARDQFARKSEYLVRRRQFAMLLAAGVGGIIAVVAIPAMYSEAPAAWSEVIDVLHERPWIHFSAEGVEGGPPIEFWISFNEGIFAMKSGDAEFVHFQNKKTGSLQWYRSSEGVLHHGEDRRPPGELGQLESLLTQMSGNASSLELAGPDEILTQSRREVVRDGAKSWVYQFTLKAFGIRNAKTYTVIFSVDPTTKLLTKWQRKMLDGSKELSFSVDYPAEGPNDIFALGVPRDLE